MFTVSLVLHSIQQNIIFQHYYHSQCNYLLKIGGIDKEQAVFEQLILNNFKKGSSTVLKTFNNYTMTLISNSYKIRISSVWCFYLCCLFLS